MKNYYLEESIENIEDQTGEDGKKVLKDYFKSRFSEDELLELLIRGQIHAEHDDRTRSYYSK